MLRGTAELDAGSPAEAYDVLLAGARQAAAEDPMLALDMLTRAAEASWMSGRMEGLADLGGLAAQVASGDGDEEAFMVALLRGVGELLRDEGEGGAPELRDALALASTLPRPRHQLLACIVAVWLGDVSAGLTATRTAVSRLRASGGLAELSFALQQLGAFESWEGRLSAAESAAAEAVALATENRQDTIAAHALAVLARIEAMQGQGDRARRHALASLEASVARGLGLPASAALWALGRLEVVLGRPEDALSHLLAVAAPRDGFASPIPALLSAPDLVEAAVRGGRPELAAPSLRRFEDWQRRTGSVWGAGVAGRMRRSWPTPTRRRRTSRRPCATRIASPCSRSRARVCITASCCAGRAASSTRAISCGRRSRRSRAWAPSRGRSGRGPSCGRAARACHGRRTTARWRSSRHRSARSPSW